MCNNAGKCDMSKLLRNQGSIADCRHLLHKTDPITKKCEEQASNHVLSEYKIRFSVNKLLVNSVPCQSPSEELIRDYRSSLRTRIDVNYIFCYSPLFPAQHNLSTRAINVMLLSTAKTVNASQLRPYCLLSSFHFFLQMQLL